MKSKQTKKSDITVYLEKDAALKNEENFVKKIVDSKFVQTCDEFVIDPKTIIIGGRPEKWRLLAPLD